MYEILLILNANIRLSMEKREAANATQQADVSPGNKQLSVEAPLWPTLPPEGAWQSGGSVT